MLTNDEIKLLRQSHKGVYESTLLYFEQGVNAPGIDQRALALAKTNLQQAFMWLNEATPVAQEEEQP